jgi:hypothetical protein
MLNVQLITVLSGGDILLINYNLQRIQRLNKEHLHLGSTYCGLGSYMKPLVLALN